MIPEQNSMLWRIDVRGRYLDQDIVNTFEYEAGNFVNGPDVNAVNIFTAFTQNAFSPYRPLLDCMVDEYTTRQIIVYRESADVTRRYAMYFPITDSGTIAEAGLPSQVTAVVIRRAQPQNGRGLRGRLYVGCVPQIYTHGGTITAGTPYRTALDDLALSLRHTINFLYQPDRAVFVEPIITTARRRIQPAGGVNLSGISDTAVRVQLGNQRRRAPGHGRRG